MAEKKLKLKKEIQITLEQEKSNIFEGHQDESNLQGWIEALEYVIREIELLDKSDDLEALKIHKKAEKLIGLEVNHITSLTDYFIICSANSLTSASTLSIKSSTLLFR